MSRKQSQKRFQFSTLWKNNILLSFVGGVITGLIIAIIIAIIITRSPMPFNSKMSKHDKTLEKKTCSDPNEPMYVNRDPAKENYKKMAAEASIISELTKKSAASNTSLNYIQAGAYRDKKEAENMRARLALLGMEAAISEVKTPNSVFYRVRLGPYSQKNLEAVQENLRKSGIEFTTTRS